MVKVNIFNLPIQHKQKRDVLSFHPESFCGESGKSQRTHALLFPDELNFDSF